jgi:bifunctional DNase/RNase
MLRGLGSELLRVLITKVVDNTYHAELIIRRDGDMISIDARPSDSIAIALRAKAPIFAHSDLLEQASIEIQPAEVEPSQPPDAVPADETDGMDAEQLKEYLKKLRPEDFGRFNP